MITGAFGQHTNFCPACSRTITFISAATNYKVCEGCGAVLQRKEQQQPVITRQTLIAGNNSRIQPGTTGYVEGSNFTVTGCFRAWFDEAVFNYWTIETDDHITEILAEGYGLFGILDKSPIDHQFTSGQLDRLQTGSLIQFPDSTADLLVEKKQKLIFTEGEGEWYMPEWGRETYFIEVVSAKGERYCFINSGSEQVFLFSIRVVQRASLSLKNLRDQASPPPTKNCPECGTPVTQLAYPFSKSFGCAACGAEFSIKSQEGKIKKRGRSAKELYNYHLKTGSTGTIEGVTYTVTGYTEKKDHSTYQSRWREYTLYNPDEGFAFLSEYDGHWTFLKETWDGPFVSNVNTKAFTHNGRTFDIYNSYRYSIVKALGEFPADIFDNSNTDCYEYIHPPYIWVQERDHHEGIRWFKGEHISGRTLAKAFPGITLPYKVGVGAVQPTSISSRNLSKATAIGLLALVLVYFLSVSGKEKRVLFAEEIPFAGDTTTVSLVTGKFEFDKNRSNVELDITAAVRNSWFELSATLVNAQTGKEYSLEKGVEYYSGYEGGEYWTEGGTHATAYFTRIPAGTYFFQLQGTREAIAVSSSTALYSAASVPSSFGLTITYDVPNERNFWFSLLLFLLYPVVTYIRNYYRESGRWNNSPFTTQNKSDD